MVSALGSLIFKLGFTVPELGSDTEHKNTEARPYPKDGLHDFRTRLRAVRVGSHSFWDGLRSSRTGLRHGTQNTEAQPHSKDRLHNFKAGLRGVCAGVHSSGLGYVAWLGWRSLLETKIWFLKAFQKHRQKWS